MFPFTALPPDLIFLVSEFLPKEDFLNLCECLDIVVTKERYKSLFYENTIVKECSADKVRERRHADAVIFVEANLTRRIVTLASTTETSEWHRVFCIGRPFSQLSLGSSCVFLLCETGHIRHSSFRHLRRWNSQLRGTIHNQETLKLRRERWFAWPAPEPTEVIGGSRHGMSANGNGLFGKILSGDCYRGEYALWNCQLYFDIDGPALRGVVSRPRLGRTVDCCHVEGTGIVFWQREWPHEWLEKLIDERYYHGVVVDVVPKTMHVQDYVLVEDFLVIIDRRGAFRLVDIKTMSTSDISEGPFVLIDAHLTHFMLLREDGMVAVGDSSDASLLTWFSDLQGLDIASITVGRTHYFAVTQDGQLYSREINGESKFARIPLIGNVYDVDVGGPWVSVLVSNYKDNPNVIQRFVRSITSGGWLRRTDRHLKKD